jgi:hypothetical protein
MIIAGINLIMHTSRIDEQITSNTDKEITSILNASTRNCNRNWKKIGTDCIRCCRRIQVRVGVEVRVGVGTSIVSHVVNVEAADVRKEVLAGKESSVDMMPSVVAQKRSPKT